MAFINFLRQRQKKNNRKISLIIYFTDFLLLQAINSFYSLRQIFLLKRSDIVWDKFYWIKKDYGMYFLLLKCLISNYLSEVFWNSKL